MWELLAAMVICEDADSAPESPPAGEPVRITRSTYEAVAATWDARAVVLGCNVGLPRHYVIVEEPDGIGAD